MRLLPWTISGYLGKGFKEKLYFYGPRNNFALFWWVNQNIFGIFSNCLSLLDMSTGYVDGWGDAWTRPRKELKPKKRKLLHCGFVGIFKVETTFISPVRNWAMPLLVHTVYKVSEAWQSCLDGARKNTMDSYTVRFIRIFGYILPNACY